jgi:hypothetical protein
MLHLTSRNTGSSSGMLVHFLVNIATYILMNFTQEITHKNSKVDLCNLRLPRWRLNLVEDIQGDSGGNITILRGDIINHCEKKSAHAHISYSEWLPRYSCFNLQIKKSIVNGYKERELAVNIVLILIWCLTV